MRDGAPAISRQAKRVSRLNSSKTEARSAALPACSDGFDNVDGGPECGVYIQMGGVEQVRIRGQLERSDGAAGVALVAAANVGHHFVVVNDLACALQLRQTPAGTGFRGRGDED